MNRGRLMMMFALALAGCAFSGADGDGDGDGDGTGSGPGNGSGGGGSNMTEPPRCAFTYVNVCSEAPGAALTYSASTTINTSVDASCTSVVAQGAGQPELCVIHAKSVTINSGAIVRAIGTRPLALVSAGNLTIAGTLDVSSARQSGSDAEVLGAGAEAMACQAFVEEPDNGNEGGGGGAGGTFSGKGGEGGDAGAQKDGGTAANAYSLSSVGFLRGGCRGQTGGTGNSATGSGPPGMGGPGGGAVYLAASGDITIETAGRVAANGGGGRGGGALAGGGGGGSGGMILLEGKATHRGGMITANGGGGGQGGVYANPFGGPLTAFTGGSGENGELGAGAADGGATLLTGMGGAGSDATTRNGRSGGDGTTLGPGPNGAAAGGGGGAAGFIRILGASDGAGPLSPPLSN